MNRITSGISAALLAVFVTASGFSPVSAAPVSASVVDVASHVELVQYRDRDRPRYGRERDRRDRFEHRRDRRGYWNGHRGYREHRRGYRRHTDGYYYPPAVFRLFR